MACMSRSRNRAPRQQQRQLALLAFVSCLLLLAPSASAFQPLPRPDDLALPTESPSSSSSSPPRGGDGAGVSGGRTCWYTVRIKTSCASPARTTDAVSLAFGDQYRNEVYAARLGGAGAGAFGRCATDTFKVGGPCGYGVCYLYLRRTGRAGWTPEWVRVDAPRAAGGASSTFYYGEPLPDGVWYGFNRCPHRASSSSSSPSSAAAAAAAQAL